MKRTELNLIVPQQTDQRNEILRLVKNYFLNSNLVPPISYNRLKEIAEEICEKNSLSDNFLAFTMVCCGNEVWKKVIASIPFERRILLLPECLKNSKECNASKDSFGILCESCGSCSIDSILIEAEDMGYVTVVTEGTTIAQKLIEEGNVDAIIGVGCMEALEKLFYSVSKFAIPSIGVPLLYNGCKDTATDKQWLLSELRNIDLNTQQKHLNLNHLLKRIKKIFSKHELIRVLGQPKGKSEEIALNYLEIGGQRLRPFFTSMIYKAFEKEYNISTDEKLAIAIECFHKASLIHDDIEDDDTERYGQKAIHAEYGVPVAINTGDYLLGLGYKLISSCNIEASRLAECMKVASDGHVALASGQGHELVSVNNNSIPTLDEVIEIFLYKTAAAFKVSMLLGSCAAGINGETKKLLSEICNSIGIAYQIKDDLSDYKGAKGDIIHRKFSIILSLLMEETTEDEKDSVLTAISNKQEQILLSRIDELSIIDKTIMLLKQYLTKALESLESLDNLAAKLALHESIGKIFDEYV